MHATFEEFWPHYVSQHQDPRCRALHVAGTGLGLAGLAVSPVFPPALPAGIAAGYALSWIGHFAFEKNTPASWVSPKHFAWSLRGDLRMFRLTLSGKMQSELTAAD